MNDVFSDYTDSDFTDYIAIHPGLSTQNAENNLALYGFNSDSKLDEDGKGFKSAGVFFSARFVLMVVSAAALYISGNALYGSVCVLLTAVYACSEIIKGTKCDEILHKLRRSGAVRYRVIRDGELVFLPKERIVPDDIIVLGAGENVPADAHLLEVTNVTCDESLFTGDKTPTVKITGADGKNEIKQTCIYKGTRITSGRLAARVTATGLDTKKHKRFGGDIHEDIYFTAFENAINKVIPVFSLIALILFAASVAIMFLSGETGSVWRMITDSLLPSLAFALCFIPAETASVVRVYYTYSALKLAKAGSIVKELSGLEKLASVTAVLVDKSGVVTKNNIEVAEEFSKNPEMLSRISILSCDITPTSSFDKAVILNAAFKHINIRELQQNELIKSFPFSDEYKLGGNLWRINNSRLLCIKGSPDRVFALCQIQPDQLYSLQKKQLQYGKQGKQVIAIAYAKLEDDRLIPDEIHDVKYIFAGFLAFTSQTRDSIPDAIRGCYRSGVKVIMVTGDSTEAAEAISARIGMKNINVMTGTELKTSIESGENPDISNINVFAKTSSEQRIDIINLLKQSGEIVGITGSSDDIDVLLEADLSVARSLSATGAAQESCALIMSDDNFGSLVDAVKEARQTHRNIKSAVSVSLSSTVVFILFSTLNLLLGKPMLLSCVPISLLSVVIVSAVMLFFLGNAADIRGHFLPSDFVGRGKINKGFFGRAIFSGIFLFLASLFLLFLLPDAEEANNRTHFLITFAFGIITMGFINLSQSTNSFNLFGMVFRKGSIAGFVCGILLLFLLIIIYVPFISVLFGFCAVNPLIFIISAALGVVSQIPAGLIKLKKSKNIDNNGRKPLND